MRKRKLLSLIMAMAMVLSLLPATVWAEGDTILVPSGSTSAVTTEDGLKDAVTAADSTKTVITLGGNIKLNSTLEIPADKNIVLDLQGHELSINSDIHVIDNKGILSVKNGTVAGHTTAAKGAAVNNSANAVLTVTQDANKTTKLIGRCGIENAGNVTVYNGQIESYNRNAYWGKSGSNLTVYDGSFSAPTGSSGMGRAISSEGAVTIHGGSFSASGSTGAGDNYMNAIGMFYATAVLKIQPTDGKTVTVTSETDYAVATRYGAEVNIYGGEFTCKGARTDINNIDDEYDDVIHIYGGSFKHEPYADYLDSRAYVEQEGGRYIVKLLPDSVNTPVRTYEELVTAMAGSATEPKDIVMAENITIPSDGDLTLKKGYSLTIPSGLTLTVNGVLRLNDRLVNQGTLTVSDEGFIERPLHVDNQGTITNYPTVENGVCTVSTPMELQWLSCIVEWDNDNIPATIQLANDIVMPDAAFTPIGNSNFYYNSVFDGNKCTISNLQLNITSEYRGGLFGNVGDVTIQNLTISGTSTNSTSSYIGALVGYMGGSCTVSNVHIKEYTVSSPISFGVGGFVGQIWTNDSADRFEFIGCTTEHVDVTGYANVGGIWGTSTGSLGTIGIYNCKLGGTVKALNVNGAVCGGFVNSAPVEIIGLQNDVTATVNNAQTSNLLSAISDSNNSIKTSFSDSKYQAVKDENGQWTAVDGSVETVATINGAPYSSLSAAMKAAKSGETVTLAKSTKFSDTISVGSDKSFTLNLNGNTATYTGAGTYAFELSGGVDLIVIDTVGNGALVAPKRTIKVGSGTINTSGTPATLTLNGGTIKSNDTEENSAIAIYANNSATHNGTSSVACEVEVNKATVKGGIYVFGEGAKVTVNEGAVIDTNGYYAISGNGSKSATQNNGGTVIDINGGIITQTGTDGGAIYHPQDGILDISGNVSITGASGIQLCSGEGVIANITGGTITATGADQRSDKTGDGFIPDGAAVSVVNRSYPGGTPKMTISGGTFVSQQSNSVMAYTWSNNRASDWAEAKTYFTITGGTFSSDPSAYAADGYIAKRTGNGPYTYTVLAKNNLTDGIYMSDPTGFTASNYYVTNNNDDTWTVYYSSPSGGGGSSSGNKTETVTNPDGSTTTTVTKPDGTVTETTKNPDGSKEVVETKKDGTVTTTTTDKAGNKTETVEKTDGSIETAITNKDGSSSTTTVSKDGQVEAEVKLPTTVVDNAQEEGEPVALPMPEVPVTTDEDDAPTVTVDLPAGRSARVLIPVDDVTPGTVAILVHENGTKEIAKTSITTEEGVVVTLSDGDTVKVMDNAKDFADVPDAYWGSAFVDFATSRGLFSGTSATTFSPDLPMTRAMIVTVLAAYDGADTTAAAGDHWYSAGQQWAMENGVSDGTNMEGVLTREQLAVMLWSYAGRPEASISLSRYSDAGSVSAWAADAMTWAVENGLISGSDKGELLPQGQATRVQVATILMRFVETTNG